MKIKVDIANADGTVTDTAFFDSQESVQAWLDERKFPSDRIVTQTDVTALAAAQALVEESEQAMAVGRAVLAKLRAINKSKGLDAAALTSMMAMPTMQLALFELLTGSLAMAKAAIQAVSNDAYSDADKAELVAILDQSGLA